MAKLITNQGEFLNEIIRDIVPCSENLYFLVGYFYFSGFEEIYKEVGDKHLKILVGMNIEKDLSNNIKEYFVLQELNQSRLEIKQNYYKSFVEIFNDTDYFDSDERITAFRMFLEKIKNGTLEIKKTATPNHAKMYLFEHKADHAQGGNLPGTMITGSSNLTLSGLKVQGEINVILYTEYKDGKKIFDDLWKTAIDIATEADITEFTEEVIKKIWYEKLYAPYLFYVRVLHEYFSIQGKQDILLPSQITKGKYFNLQYQVDAIKKALLVLEEHNGALIADVAGLGKSIIASAVAYNLGKKVIIIAPPHLYEQWDKEYRTLFAFTAVVFGSGSVHKALEHLQYVWDDEEVLIIVDEAHKYRNEDTDDYIRLHQLCQGNKVLLLTATPFNNRPQDIFSMIKLFQIPSRSTIRTVDNLSYRFTELTKEYKDINRKRKDKTLSGIELKKRINDLAQQIRFIMEPIIIRRSRIDLDKIDLYREDLERQKVKYVIPEPPIIKEYFLGDLTQLYLSTLNKIASEDGTGFIGARYKSAHYIEDLEKFRKSITNENADVESIGVAQTNLAKFMRRLLVGRFESSVNAFGKTLESMIQSMEGIKEYYEKLQKVPIYKKGKMPLPDDLLFDLNDDALAEIEDYSFEEELKKEFDKGLVFIPAQELKAEFIVDLNHDIDLLKEIQKDWFGKGSCEDPKLDSFKLEIIKQLKEDPDRKIVVFSEYTDTAKYVFDNIKDDPIINAIYYSSSESDNVRKTIKENFDASSKVQKDDYNIIIATDALSEGINLNRAGTVFNYDIPYNPTRVIQRVGRINRIGKMLFEKLYIYNYFPTDIGEGHINIREISTLKKAMIDALLGEDTQVLTDEEQLVSYFHEEYNKALENQESESWDAQYQNEYQRILNNKPEILDKASAIEHRCRARRTVKKDRAGVLVFGKKGEDFTFRLGTSNTESEAITAEEALKLFKAELTEKPQAVSATFDAIYQNTKKYMYVTKSKIATQGKRAQNLNKLKALINEVPEQKDYLQDLYTVAKELNALPDGVYNIIRKIDTNTIDKDIKVLMEEVPHGYLDKIIKAAKKIDEGTESLILSEELI
ncbi:MAG: helicase-related protein [Candidatus Cloacimonetes bacterium]|nr:helicase-related protein [Candidatus Cloacimonadota bacterium]